MKRLFALAALVMVLSGCSLGTYNSSDYGYGTITVVNGSSQYVLEVKEADRSYGVIQPGESVTIKAVTFGCHESYIRKSVYVIAWDGNGMKGVAEKTFTIRNIENSHQGFYPHRSCENQT